MLGNIVERSSDAPTPPSAPRAPSSSSAGFPTILHRSAKPKRPSAFAAANARQARDTGVGKAVEFDDIPRVTQSLQSALLDGQAEAGPSKPRAVTVKEDEYSRVQREIGDENRRKVAEMTTEERDEELRELEERFGAGVLAALKKRASKRAAGGNAAGDGGIVERHGNASDVSSTSAPKALAPGKGEPVGQKVAAAPPKSVKFASSPPPDADLKSTYFANTPAEPDKLAWMSSSSSDAGSSIRFDLSGHLLSSVQQSDLPTHLGLHHHGDQPDLAGYTISEILHLCRSTVPAQRVGMMGLLTKVIGTYVLPSDAEGEEVRRICAEGRVCEKAVSLCVDILHTTRNVSLLQVAIELLYSALGGPAWALASSAAFRPNADAGGRAAPVSSVPFEDLLHRLSELLTTPDYLPSISIQHLLLILRLASISDRETAETILPLLPPTLQTHVTRRPWPAQASKLPLVEPLRLMGDLIASSRTCASEIVDAGLPGSLLRFCVVSTWADDGLGVELCIEVLRIFAGLARYGLAAGTARTAHDIWVVLGEHVSSHLDSADGRSLAEAYFSMLEGWTTCAIDPHRTTPEHDLTWTQIAGLGWAEQACSAIEREGADVGVVSSAVEVLVAWTTGLGVNGAKGGKEEKAELGRRLGKTGLATLVRERIAEGAGSSGDRLMLSVLRLQAQLPSDGSAEATLGGPEHLAHLDAGRSVQYELLRSALNASPNPSNTKSAIDLLTSFQPGDEPLALDLLDELFKLDWSTSHPSLSPLVKGIEHPDFITLLRPLLQHAILPNVTDITAPTQPHHLYLKATGSLRSPPPSVPNETGRTPPGLPLRPEWFFHPIDELLHSADSAALQQAPMDWTPTELEIVRATMVFLRLALASGLHLGRSELLFGMMKVYMLEHQTGGMVNTGESEIFRDDVVKECLGRLLDGLGQEASSEDTSSVGPSTPKPGLEVAAIPFLGLEPFYQFYTDLVSLFENASFGDATFARILLPPLSMAYPADFRKTVWGNPNVIRLIRTQLKDVPLEQSTESDGLKAFFEPVESDPEVLSAYGQAVVRGWVKPGQGLVWEVAIYHLRIFFASDDEGAEGKSAGEKEKQVALARLRKGLRGAVMGSGNDAVVAALSVEGDVQPWR